MTIRLAVAPLILALAAGCAGDNLKPYNPGARGPASNPTSSSECHSNEILLCKSQGPRTRCRCADRNSIRYNIEPLFPSAYRY